MKATCAGIVAASQIPAGSEGPRGGPSEQPSSSQALWIASLLNSCFLLQKAFSSSYPERPYWGISPFHPIKVLCFQGTITDGSLKKLGGLLVVLEFPSSYSNLRCQADYIMQKKSSLKGHAHEYEAVQK